MKNVTNIITSNAQHKHMKINSNRHRCSTCTLNQWQIGRGGAKFPHFHVFFGENWSNCRFFTLQGLALLSHPVSITVNDRKITL